MNTVRFKRLYATTASHIPNDDQRQSIHLYRALLRECTYLPDPTARRYLPCYLRWRFDRLPKPKGEVKGPIDSDENAKHRETATKGLTYIRRANAGHLRHLTKILEIAYGRTRRRRYELLQDIKPEASAILQCNTPEDLMQAAPQLMTLIRSQAIRPKHLDERGPVKAVAPMVPKFNSWGRQTPQKRVKNIKLRWFAHVMERAQPPLPKAEWEWLKRLASGEEAWVPVAPRRKGSRFAPSTFDSNVPAQSVLPNSSEALKHTLAENLRSETLQGVMSAARRRVAEAVQGEQTQEDHHGNTKKWLEWSSHMSTSGMSRPRDLQPRSMRRLWQKISVQCPMMEQVDGRWKVRWADTQKERSIGLRGEIGGGISMFEGVDEKGKNKKDR